MASLVKVVAGARFVMDSKRCPMVSSSPAHSLVWDWESPSPRLLAMLWFSLIPCS